jgi:hypothetical protein
MDLDALQRLVVEEGFQPNNVDLQEEIILCTMGRLLKGRALPSAGPVSPYIGISTRGYNANRKDGFRQNYYLSSPIYSDRKGHDPLIPLCTLGKAHAES